MTHDDGSDDEKQYHDLFDAMDLGFCVIQMLFGQQGQPHDYRFLISNPAFEHHTGLVNANGKTMRELVPDLDEFWFRTYGKIAKTGKSLHFESHAPAMKRWFDVHAVRLGTAEDNKIGIVFTNVTAQKKGLEAVPHGAESLRTAQLRERVHQTERRRLEQERERLVNDLREANRRQRRFLKEMLAGFTEGRLQLCFTPDELPAPLSPLSDPFDLTASELRLLRHRIEAVGEGLRLSKERLLDFMTATHEAAMNAVRHGGGGTAQIYGDRDTGTAQVWIRDNGPGIADDRIHRAVEQGFTTGGFGHGFFFMQSFADHLYLLSLAGRGTTVVLEMDRTPPQPAWVKALQDSL